MNVSNDLKIELIPVLISILDTLSLTRTAKNLGVTQSAVSHSLKKLRQEWGDDLVIRQGNTLVPTTRAEEIYPALKRWMSELEHLREVGQFDPKTSQQVFYIATTDVVEQMFMPHILKHFQKVAPRIGLRLIRWDYTKLQNQLLNSEVDMAIGVRSLDFPNLMQRPLYEESFWSAARKDHPIFKNKKISLEQYIAYPHTMTSSGDRVKGVVDRALEKLNRQRDLTHTVSNFSSAPVVVEHSDCLLTAPRRFLEFCALNHDIKTFQPPIELPEFTVKLYWTRKNQKDPARAWLRQQLYDVFAAAT